MGRHVVYMGKDEYIYSLVVKTQGKGPLRSTDVGGRIILNWTLAKRAGLESREYGHSDPSR
jgi:hypothetical protein